MTQQRKVTGIFLEKRLQLRLLSYFIGLFVLTTASLYSAIFLFFWRFKTKALDTGIPEDHVFFRFLANQKHDMDLLFIWLVVFNFLLLLTVGLLISHRIAGPYRKLKMHLQSLQATSPDFKLRQKDFFQDVGPIVNALRDRLKK